MKKDPKKFFDKKTIFALVGAVLVVGTLLGGNLKYIFVWSTMEQVGGNIWSLISIFGGVYLVYFSIKK